MPVLVKRAIGSKCCPKRWLCLQVGNYILLEVGLFLNYQPVRPRRVFRGELKEALLRTLNQSRLLIKGVAVQVGKLANYISGAS